MLSRRRSSLAPPLPTRSPPPPAHGPADSGRGDWRRRPDLRGAGGERECDPASKSRTLLAGSAHEAGKRSSPPDRSGRGADGARRGGLVRHADRQLRPAAGRRATHRASWRAAEGNCNAHRCEHASDGARANAAQGGGSEARTARRKCSDEPRRRARAANADRPSGRTSAVVPSGRSENLRRANLRALEGECGSQKFFPHFLFRERIVSRVSQVTNMMRAAGKLFSMVCACGRVLRALRRACCWCRGCAKGTAGVLRGIGGGKGSPARIPGRVAIGAAVGERAPHAPRPCACRRPTTCKKALTLPCIVPF